MGRGSKIFIIAFLISACIFGLISFAIISALTDLSAPIADPDSLSEGAVRTDSSRIKGRSFNLLVVNVDYRPEKYSYDPVKVSALFGDNFGKSASSGKTEIKMLSAVIVRLDKEREQFTFTPIPANTYVSFEEKMLELSDVYEDYGITALCKQVRSLTGLAIDEYAVIIPSAAEKIVNSLGGLEYSLISSVSAENEVTVQSGNRKLYGEQVRTLMLCDYSGNSITRETVAVELIKKALEIIAQGGEASALEHCKSIADKLHTSLDTDRLTENSGLIAAYRSFDKKDLTLCGKYADGRFVPDVAATIDRFLNYRKYYA